MFDGKISSKPKEHSSICWQVGMDGMTKKVHSQSQGCGVGGSHKARQRGKGQLLQASTNVGKAVWNEIPEVSRTRFRIRIRRCRAEDNIVQEGNRYTLPGRTEDLRNVMSCCCRHEVGEDTNAARSCQSSVAPSKVISTLQGHWTLCRTQRSSEHEVLTRGKGVVSVYVDDIEAHYILSMNYLPCAAANCQGKDGPTTEAEEEPAKHTKVISPSTMQLPCEVKG
ncbi:hypothetical protein E2C01_063709 [Portunus trituberculatus]|uniref:Uncharacterized protein n=1 Tax=Portunus trituberculatus TaxID=210409 RepID=A0A5B7HH38_PORTR|nr:hypothetical protein [Portunus trituberculatus]